MIYEANQNSISLAAKAIIDGEVIAFPTETVYGLGACALNKSAVQKIFTIKGRPSNNPLIVHIPDLAIINQVADLSKNLTCEKRLFKLSKLWPGPLSVILPKSNLIPDIVTAGGDTVAVRIPDHPVALQLLKECALPVAAPSANPSGYISPTTAKHVSEILGSRIDIILDGGDCQVGLESTVISIAKDKVILMRPGVITKEELEDLLSETVELQTYSSKSAADGILASPGQLSTHYSPRTTLKFIDQLTESDCNKKIGLIELGTLKSASHNNLFSYHHVVTLSNRGDLTEIAQRLFYALREMDKMLLDIIVIERCEDSGIGVAIMDRLNRAVK